MLVCLTSGMPSPGGRATSGTSGDGDSDEYDGAASRKRAAKAALKRSMRGGAKEPSRKKPRLAAAAEKSKLSLVTPPAPTAAGAHSADGLPGWPASGPAMYPANGSTQGMPMPGLQVRVSCRACCPSERRPVPSSLYATRMLWLHRHLSAGRLRAWSSRAHHLRLQLCCRHQ